ncbi:MAG: hypothetical protein KC777_06610 [Cyanobacteria bacterium HKST-UBA02]|nr:hypothetical protein [Cyanobacteria bacterium HKST-UBA02]
MRSSQADTPGSRTWRVFEAYELSADQRSLERHGNPVFDASYLLEDPAWKKKAFFDYCNIGSSGEALDYVKRWGFPAQSHNGLFSLTEVLESAASMRFLAMVLRNAGDLAKVDKWISVRGDILDQLWRQWSRQTKGASYARFMAELPLLMSSTVRKLKTGIDQAELSDIERLVKEVYLETARTDRLIFHLEPTSQEADLVFPHYRGIYTTSSLGAPVMDHDASSISMESRTFEDLRQRLGQPELVVVKEFVRRILNRMLQGIKPTLSFRQAGRSSPDLVQSFTVSTPWEGLCLELYDLAGGASRLRLCGNEKCRKLLSPATRRKEHCNATCRKEHWRQRQLQ